MSSEASTRWQFTTIGTLFVGYTGYYICRSNLSLALPLIHEEFELTTEHTGAIASVGIILYAIGKFSNGVLGDFFGGRVMFLLGMVSSVLCTVAFGLASGLLAWCLIWAANRYCQSMGWIALVKVCARWCPVHRHAKVMAILSTSYLAGDAFARWYLSSFLKYGFGWRGMFFAAAVTLAVISLVTMFTLRSSPRDIGAEEPAADPANVYGADGENERPTGFRELMLPLLASRTFWLISIINFGLTMVRESFLFWIPTFLVSEVLLSKPEAAGQSAWFPLVGALSCLLAGLASDLLRGRRGRIMFPCLTLLTLTMVCLATFDLSGRPGLSLTLICLVAFFMIGPYTYLSGVMALSLGGKSGASTAAGMVDSAGYFGAVLSGYGIGSIVAHYGWSTAFGSLAVVSGFTALAALVYLVSSEREAREVRVDNP